MFLFVTKTCTVNKGLKSSKVFRIEEKAVGLCVNSTLVQVVRKIQILQPDYNVHEVYIHKINNGRNNVTCER